jgi:hypothetical protein
MINRITFLIMIFLFLGSLLIAQSGREPIRFAVLAGVNLNNLNGKDFNGRKLENDLLIGYHIGVNAQIPLVPEFYFEPGLMFSTKGAIPTEGSITSTTRLSYVELPLNFVYKGALGSGFIMVGFGPYVAYGVQGKITTEGGAVKVDTPVDFKNIVDLGDPLTTAYFRPLDAGANIFVGYELAMGVFMQLNTQFGMLQINPEDKRFPGGDTSVKNTGFGLSIGYRF